VIEGYSIKDAAQVLGIPEGRIWELVARGVLAGTQGSDGSWRIHLGQTRPPEPEVPTSGSEPRQGNDEPRRENGGSSGERSAFRELLTEFRNLTERYGQALLALGEARGEVASLRSRVELLEARVDLRLPGPRMAPAGEPIEAAWQLAEDEIDDEIDDDVEDERPLAQPEAPVESIVPDAVVPDSWAPAVEVDLTDPVAGTGQDESEDGPTAAIEAEAVAADIAPPSEEAEIGERRRVVAFAPTPVSAPAPATPAAPPASEPEPAATEERSPATPEETHDRETDDGDPTPRRRRASSTHSALAGLAEALARAVDPALSDLPGAGIERPGGSDAKPGGEPSDVDPEAASVLHAEEPDEDEIEGADELEMAGSGWRTTDGPTHEDAPTRTGIETGTAHEQQEPEAEDVPVELPSETAELDTDATVPPSEPTPLEMVIDDMGDDPFPDQAEITDDRMLRELVASGLPDDVEPFDWEYDVSEPSDGDEVEAQAAASTSTERPAAVEPPPDEDEPAPVPSEPDEVTSVPIDPADRDEREASAGPPVEPKPVEAVGDAADMLESSPEEASEPHSSFDANDSALAYQWPIAALEPPPAEDEPTAAEPEAAAEGSPRGDDSALGDRWPEAALQPRLDEEEPSPITWEAAAEPETAPAAQPASEADLGADEPELPDELKPAEPEAAAEPEPVTEQEAATEEAEPQVTPPSGIDEDPSGGMGLPGGDELRDALRALGIEGTDQLDEAPQREDRGGGGTGPPPPAAPPEQQLSRPESEPPPAGPGSEPRAGGSTPWSPRSLAERRPPGPGEPRWLRNRRDPAASAFRRLRKLFPK
jgi:hypothetical protein